MQELILGELSCRCLPAVYADGGICLDILQNQWSPIYDVSAILTSIQVSGCIFRLPDGCTWRAKSLLGSACTNTWCYLDSADGWHSCRCCLAPSAKGGGLGGGWGWGQGPQL
jgi:hypothetical protein